MLLAIIGIALELLGFVLMIKSTKKLVFEPGAFMGDSYKDPTTGKPPPKIEGPPNPLIYRPGIYSIIVGLIFQFADIVIAQGFNYPI